MCVCVRACVSFLFVSLSMFAIADSQNNISPELIEVEVQVLISSLPVKYYPPRRRRPTWPLVGDDVSGDG